MTRNLPRQDQLTPVICQGQIWFCSPGRPPSAIESARRPNKVSLEPPRHSTWLFRALRAFLMAFPWLLAASRVNRLQPCLPFGQPGRHQGGRKGLIGQPAKHQGGRKGLIGQPGRHQGGRKGLIGKLGRRQGGRKGPMGSTREAPGRQERTNQTACEAPGRHQGGRKWPFGQPGRHQGGRKGLIGQPARHQGGRRALKGTRWPKHGPPFQEWGLG